jgi:hypothetical protein
MKTLSVLSFTLACGLVIGCSSGPPRPKPGSAAFLWEEAQQSYRIGDLLKTDTMLMELSRTDNAFAEHARIWQLIVSAGLTQGFSALADVYETGSRHDVANPLRFRNQAASLRSFAATASMEFAQGLHDLAGNQQDDTVKLAFAFPPGSLVLPEELLTISGGLWPRDSDTESVETAMLQRGVLRTVCNAVGHPGDSGAALAMFQAGEVRVPREVFVYAMAKLLYEESNLYGSRRMDRPDRFILLCREAREALRSIPQSDRTSELASMIEDTLRQASGI